MIAMGYPAVGLESAYRNARKDLVKFLETTHGNHYRVYVPARFITRSVPKVRFLGIRVRSRSNYGKKNYWTNTLTFEGIISVRRKIIITVSLFSTEKLPISGSGTTIRPHCPSLQLSAWMQKSGSNGALKM